MIFITGITFTVSKKTEESSGVASVEEKPLTGEELKEMVLKSREDPDDCLMCGS